MMIQLQLLSFLIKGSHRSIYAYGLLSQRLHIYLWGGCHPHISKDILSNLVNKIGDVAIQLCTHKPKSDFNSNVIKAWSAVLFHASACMHTFLTSFCVSVWLLICIEHIFILQKQISKANLFFTASVMLICLPLWFIWCALSKTLVAVGKTAANNIRNCWLLECSAYSNI